MGEGRFYIAVPLTALSSASYIFFVLGPTNYVVGPASALIFLLGNRREASGIIHGDGEKLGFILLMNGWTSAWSDAFQRRVQGRLTLLNEYEETQGKFRFTTYTQGRQIHP